MEKRTRIRPLPGFGRNFEEGRDSEPAGVRENRIRLLNEIASEGVRILKQNERYLPDSIERLSPSTRKKLGELTQQALAQWRKVLGEGSNVQ